MTDTEKIARLKDLLRIFTYAKYFYLICIALLFVGLFKKVSAQIQSCTGEQIAKTFEIRFFTSNTQIQTINLNIHGKEMPFRDDLVIQNADVLKVESIKDSFGKPTLKIVLTASGKEKLSKGTASSVGQLAAVIYDSQVISTPVIRDQIRSGELNTSAENLADICAEKP